MKKIVALLEEVPFAGDMHHKVSVAFEDLAWASVPPEDVLGER